MPILLSHLNAVHPDGDFKVICGLGDAPDCKKVYTKYNSFYKHIRRKHDDIYKGHTKPPDGDYFIVPNDEIEDEHHCASLVRAEEESCLSENEHVSSVGEMSEDPVDPLIKARGHAILFLER